MKDAAIKNVEISHARLLTRAEVRRLAGEVVKDQEKEPAFIRLLTSRVGARSWAMVNSRG